MHLFGGAHRTAQNYGTFVLPTILYGGPPPAAAVCRVPSRRLEDHIKDLCAKVIASRETELDPAISELKVALREHTIRLRRMVADNLARGKPNSRRSP
jgi:hypothetical protein